MSENDVIIAVATIVVFGVGSQWIGRRTGIPSLLILLPAGLLAGDVLGLVDPEELFGDELTPLVTMLVSLLLFNSGIQLRLADLPRGARASVVRLVTIGLTLTFAGGAAATALVLDVPTTLAFMAGAIFVVSGPTVVGPLLKVVRAREPTGAILNWEGTTLDPLGATLGVVVLNLILAADRGGLHPVIQMLARLGLGIGVGLVAALLLVFLMSRFLLTDDMEAAVSVMFAVAAFAATEVVLSESGLFATVTLGFVAANQEVVPTRRISGFGDTLEVLIIGTLFITLGALVSIDELVDHAGHILLIVALLVLVVRPVSTAISLAGSKLPGRDRALIGWMDPRGIVAAATASQFAVTLDDGGFEADFLPPITFGVILGTGLIYGLTAKPVAEALGVVKAPPRAIALVGDDPWLVPLARRLGEQGIDVLLVTSEPFEPADGADPSSAPMTTSLRQGIGHVSGAMERAGLHRAIVSVHPDSALTLLEPILIEEIGRMDVLRVPEQIPFGLSLVIPHGWRTWAFGGVVTRDEIAHRYADGASVEVVTGEPPDGAIELATIDGDHVAHLRQPYRPADPTQTLIALVGGQG